MTKSTFINAVVYAKQHITAGCPESVIAVQLIYADLPDISIHFRTLQLS